MKLVRPDPRTGRDDHLIPLINIIFLMLIFFMVAGQIAPRESIRVDPPVSEQKAAGEIAEHVIILDADGRIAIGERTLSAEALSERLALWQAAASGAESIGITIKADAAVTTGRLRETLDLLDAAGIAQVELITRALGQP